MLVRFLWCVVGVSCFASFGDALAASFDCSKASTAVERLICTNEGLSKLDERDADLFVQVRAAVGDRLDIGRDQIAWLRHVRNMCADEACLSFAYMRRIEHLESLLPKNLSMNAGLFCRHRNSAVECRMPYGSKYTTMPDGGSMNEGVVWEDSGQRNSPPITNQNPVAADVQPNGGSRLTAAPDSPNAQVVAAPVTPEEGAVQGSDRAHTGSYMPSPVSQANHDNQGGGVESAARVEGDNASKRSVIPGNVAQGTPGTAPGSGRDPQVATSQPLENTKAGPTFARRALDYFLLGGVGLLVFFSLFKVRQAQGANFLNDALTDVGSGSFFGWIMIKVMTVLWLILFIATLLGLVFLIGWSPTFIGLPLK